MIALLRQTRTNLYTINALTAILDACDVEWLVAAGLRDLGEAARRGVAAGRRVLALYSFMTPDLGWVREEVRAFAAEVPGAALLAGGPHATADPDGTVALGFHHVLAGGAESTLPTFLAAGGEGPAVLREGGPGRHDLDGFPPFGRGRFGPVEVTRGCPHRCGFCGVGRSRARHRSPRSVLEAGLALRSAGRTKISFITPDALRYGRDLGDLDSLLTDLRAEGLAPALGTFPSEVRPDRVTGEAMEVLARHCRNRTLVIGGQSGADSVLRRLGRGHTVADVERAALTARRYGFLPHVDLIFGLPRETLEERRATAELAQRLRREAGAKIHAHYFHPLPGTPLWGEVPTPLDEGTRAFLLDLRRGGAEDGFWEDHERWAKRTIEWHRLGWIRTPLAQPQESPEGLAVACASS